MKILNYQKITVKLILVLAFFLFGAAVNAPAAKAAETATFLIDSAYDIHGRASITAASRAVGLNAYYFVDDFYWDSKNSQEQKDLNANIAALANEFDNVIYPKMREFYGEEWSPGIDGDRKIYILLTDIKNDTVKGSYGGYFSVTNEYSKNLLDEYKKKRLDALEKEKKADPEAGKNIDYYAQKENEIKSIFTNEKELLYLNINFIGEPAIKSFLAHEFQHMINWREKTKISNVNEEIWLNEALSEYAPTALGYDNIYKGSAFESTVDDFNRNPSDPLTEWENTNSDYSNVNIFMQFLVGRYGIGILKSIIASPKIGVAAINDALQKINPQASFSDVFSDWVVTNYFNGQTIQNKKYGYANANLGYENLHISATGSFMLYSNNMAKNSIVKSKENIKTWSGKWYQFISSPILSVPDQTLKISLNTDAPGAYFRVPYVIEDVGGALILKNFVLQGDRSGNIYIDNFGTAVKSVTIMPISEKKISASGEDEIPIKFSYTASLASPYQPWIKSISPKTSATGNRTLVTIIGENFIEGLTVEFGGIPATEIKLINSKTIIAKAPPFYKNGEVSVEIISPDSTVAAAPEFFTYLPAAQDGALIRAEGDYKVYVVAGKYKRWIQSEKIFGFYNFRWSDVATVTPETRDYYITSMLVRADGDYKVYEIGSGNKKRHLSMSAAEFEAGGRKWEMVFTINNLEKNSYKTGAIITK